MSRSERWRAKAWIVRAAVVLGVSLSLILLPGQARSARADVACPWLNTAQSPGVRAQELMGAMTLEQKMRWLDEQAANNPTQTTFSGGVTYPAQVPCTPLITYADGPWEVTGVSGITTGFPVPIADTAAWDRQLSWSKGQAMGDEAFNEARNGLLAPGINLARTPFGGRNAEFMGEDPLLAGSLAAQNILGIQTGNPNEPVEAVLKHAIGNDQELDRQLSSSNIDDTTLHELDGLAFEIAIKEGTPEGVMCAYNQLNSVYSCESPQLETNYLKNELGFDGFIVSDFGAVHTTVQSLVAGMDQELNRPRFYSPVNLEAALAAGTITEAEIDQAAFRVARGAIAAGLFDHPMPATPAANSSTAAHLTLAKQMAEEGSVLLKNDGALPLSGHGLKIAVIGPTASATPTAGVSAKTVCTSNGEPSAACSNNPGFVAPLDAITARAQQDGDTVTFDNGSSTASAASTAAAADVAIVFGYYTEGEGTDRTTINLDNGGDALVSAVAAANPNTVVVLETGSAVLMPWLDQVKAVLEAWYPGVQQGSALAALVFGDANPSGHLPVTFPRSTADLPTAGSPAQYPGVFANGSTVRAPGDRTSIRQVNYTEGIQMGYRWYDAQGIQPLFPFGFGLSYTTFQFSKESVSPAPDGGLDVSVRVRNTGRTAGDEVVQAYLGAPASPPAGAPFAVRALAQFARVSLAPGEVEAVKLHIAPRALDYWSPAAQRWVRASGERTVYVGDADAASRLPQAVTVDVPATAGVTCANRSIDGTSIQGDVDVPAGTTCDLVSVTISGSLTLHSPGGVRIRNSRIEGQLIGNGATGAADPGADGENVICNSEVDGAAQIGNSGPGSPWNVGGSCGGNRFAGGLTFNNNQAASTITGNTISGDLRCAGNGSVTGSGNTVTGSERGQCAGF